MQQLYPPLDVRPSQSISYAGPDQTLAWFPSGTSRTSPGWVIFSWHPIPLRKSIHCFHPVWNVSMFISHCKCGGLAQNTHLVLICTTCAKANWHLHEEGSPGGIKSWGFHRDYVSQSYSIACVEWTCGECEPGAPQRKEGRKGKKGDKK